ncbi:hypothetical protein E4U43_005803 [Claviceps pusilla]|uniref:Uncharacterized protein n=1 Tax=Claviceps pusilla TaxID=123648 RepID=A0A9P7N308_9HYPO|nr:hypothetical protein E4U43_005803 [Claviceps pusilla]
MIDDEKHGTNTESTVDASLRGRADTVWIHSAHAVDVEKESEIRSEPTGGGKVPTRRARASWYSRLESRVEAGEVSAAETAPTC